MIIAARKQKWAVTNLESQLYAETAFQTIFPLFSFWIQRNVSYESIIVAIVMITTTILPQYTIRYG